MAALNRIDMTGMRCGRLVVVSYHHTAGKTAWWLCKCDCGNEKVVPGRNLRTNTRSCGCLHRELIRNPRRLYTKMSDREAALRHVKTTYRNSAKHRGLEFNLSDEQIESLALADCLYCGSGPMRPSRRAVRHDKYTQTETRVNGIDRLDNSKGYVPWNVAPCCYQCNWAKGKMTVDEFLAWISAVHDNQWPERRR